jgi:hypothetical protein
MIPIFLSDLIEELEGLPGQYGEKQAKLMQEISPTRLSPCIVAP